VLQLTGGRYNALHPRSTDWAWNNPDKVIPLEDVVANAVEVSVPQPPGCSDGRIWVWTLTEGVHFKAGVFSA